MKIVKIVLIGVGGLIVLLVALFAVYLLAHRQGVIATSELENPEAAHTVLIASQGSKFKNALVESLIVALKQDPVSVRIVDVTTLGEIDEADWDAVVIIHTTEKYELPPGVKSFLERAKDPGKIVLVTTSGDGKWRTKDYPVDALTSASRTSELASLGNAILNRLDVILAGPVE